MLMLYRLLWWLLNPLIVLWLSLPRGQRPTAGKRWYEYYGFGKQLPFNQPPLWLHAASVGEVRALIPLLEQLSAQQPILLTTMTAAGAQALPKHLQDKVAHRFMPLDLPSVVRRFIRRYQPQQLIIMETELWPHWLRHSQLNISIINARLSPKSLKHYQYFSHYLAPLLAPVTVIAQSAEDAARFAKLGAKQLHVSGNIKFDQRPDEALVAQGQQWRQQLGTRPVLLFASTHADEEALALTVAKHCAQTLPQLLLVIVPRHPQRFASVEKLLQQQQVSYCKRSLQQLPQAQQQVWLADTMGEMPAFIACADIVVMGGTFANIGGHNVLEPAAQQKACFIGPHTHEIRQLVQLLSAQQAIISSTEAQLPQQILASLQQPQGYQQASRAAHKLWRTQQGALARTLTLLKRANTKAH